MSLNLFQIKDGNVAINSPEILTIESFRTIVKRDKNSDGAGGKLLAYKELAYVWYLADYDSPFNKQGKSVKDSNKEAIAKIGLPDDWKADAIVKQAIKDYKDLNQSVAKEVIDELLKIFSYYGKIVSKVRKSVESHLDNDSALTKTQAEELVGLVNSIMVISKGIPTEIKNLNDALIELRKDELKESYDVIRGSTEAVPSSADPDRDY